ncbi:MAG: cobalamin-dependent protein [Nitrospirae bacterium]|nr:cobalamin-dependent protein [Nitrospirota bacterium]
MKEIIAAYNEAIFDANRDRALKIIREAVDNGVAPEDIVFKVVVPALEVMMKGVSETRNVSLAQHFLAAQIAAEVTEDMVARFRKAPAVAGSVVIGTSQGDFHGLGKKIISGCLKALMIEVIDLGLNVPPERFVDEAVAHGAQVIAISSMMVHTALGENGCLKVRQILKQRGLEDKIKVIVGGAPYRHDPNLYKVVRADAWAEDAITAGKVIAGLIKGVRK